MVKVTDAHQSELAALIRQQERDDHSNHVRRGGPETGLDLDKLPARPEPRAVIFIDGRSGGEWDAQERAGEPCAVCNGDAGHRLCEKCDNLKSRRDSIRSNRGRVAEVGGPTTYAPDTTRGLKGGVGR